MEKVATQSNTTAAVKPNVQPGVAKPGTAPTAAVGFKPALTPPAGAKPPVPSIKANADPTKKAQLRPSGIPFKIEPIGPKAAFIKALIYGAHGSGKTTLLGSAADVPEMRDILLIDVEGGSSVISETNRISNPQYITKVSVTEYITIAHIHDFLNRHCIARDKNDIDTLKKLESAVTGVPYEAIIKPRMYRTVILDSLTEAEAYSVYSILGIDPESIIQDDMETAGWPEFRKNFESLKLLVRALRNLPMNILMTCALSWSQDEKKRYYYSPQMTGKLKTSIQGFVDIVGYLIAGESKDSTKSAPRRLYVQPVMDTKIGRFDAKNRLDSYQNAYFENPTMTTIMVGTGMVSAEGRDIPEITDPVISDNEEVTEDSAS